MCVTNADLDLNSKLIIFEGNNGQGKSSVMEAIALCFSERKRSDSVKEMIQKGYEHAFIYLELEYNNEPIVFDVSLNEKQDTPFKRDVLYKGKHYINSEVSDLLDLLNFKFFSDIILSMQGQDDITLMTPIQRANLLQSLFQFDFDDKIKSIQSKLDEYSMNALSLKEKINFLTKEIEQKKTKKLSITYKQQNLTEKEYQKVKDEINECTERINEMNNVLLESNKLHQRKNDLFNERMKLNIKELEYRQDEAKKSKKMLESLKYDEEADTLSRKSQELDAAISQAKNELTEAENEDSSIVSCIQSINNDQNIFMLRLKNVTKKIDLAAKGVCPECGQSTCNIDKKALDEEKTQYEADIKTKQSEAAEQQRRLAEANSKKKALTDRISQLSAERQSLSLQKAALDSKNSVYLSKIMPQDQWDRLESDIANAKNKEKEYSDEIQDIESKIASFECEVLKKEELQKRKDQLKLVVAEYDSISSMNAQVAAQTKLIDEEITSSEKALEEAKAANVSNSKDIQVYEEVKKILSRELPNYLIVKTCSKLEAEMNSFVQIVFPTFRLRLLQSKKGVEFFYSLDKNADMSNLKQLINSKMASGYERAVLGIAFKAALCRAYGLTFAAFDEIDQAASDENSIKTFESLIYSNIFSQIFVITHKNATKEVLKQLEDSSVSYHVSKGNFILNDNEDD